MELRLARLTDQDWKVETLDNRANSLSSQGMPDLEVWLWLWKTLQRLRFNVMTTGMDRVILRGILSNLGSTRYTFVLQTKLSLAVLTRYDSYRIFDLTEEGYSNMNPQ